MDEQPQDPGFVAGAGTEVAALRAKVQACLLQGPGVSPVERRRAAFSGTDADPQVRRLVETVAETPWKVTDDLLAGALRAGLREDEVFELVVAAAFGQANRQLASAHRVLDAVFAPTSPDHGREAS